MPLLVDNFPISTLNRKCTLRGNWTDLLNSKVNVVTKKSWCASRPQADSSVLGFVISDENTDFDTVNEQIIMRFNNFWSGYRGMGENDLMQWDAPDVLAQIRLGEWTDKTEGSLFQPVKSIQFVGRQRLVRISI